LGTVYPVIVKDPSGSVVAAAALTTLPSINVDTTEDAAKPLPLMLIVEPPVNEAGVIVATALTVKLAVAVFPKASNAETAYVPRTVAGTTRL